MVDLIELRGSEERLEKSYVKCIMYSRHTCVQRMVTNAVGRSLG